MDWFFFGCLLACIPLLGAALFARTKSELKYTPLFLVRYDLDLLMYGCVIALLVPFGAFFASLVDLDWYASYLELLGVDLAKFPVMVVLGLVIPTALVFCAWSFMIIAVAVVSVFRMRREGYLYG